VSEEELQLKLTWLEEAAVAVKPVGALGAVVSPPPDVVVALATLV
jgi:hypothetical protein